jgi:hypothetical protein
MSLTNLERQVSALVNSDACPRPTTAQDSASPNFMGLASLGLEIGIFCGFLYSVLLWNAILGLYFLGRALSRP